MRIYDKEGHERPTGEQGRIFVGTSMPFEGYTGGGHKDIIDGLLSTGDIGYIGEDGRLYIDGRDDDMIVSGGENVFPGRSKSYWSPTGRSPPPPRSASMTRTSGNGSRRTSS